MNAVTRGGGEEHFRDVQNQVMLDEVAREGIPEERLYAFILDNAPLFRYFATHLPEELGPAWDTATTDEDARAKLEERYSALRSQIKTIFEQRFDADTQSALTDASENGDVATAERILEAHLALAGRSEE